MKKFLEELNISMDLADGYKRKHENLDRSLIAIFLRSRGWDTWYSENYWVHEDMAPGKDHTKYGTSLQLAFIYEVCDLKGKMGSYEEISEAAEIETMYMDKAKQILKLHTTAKRNLK